MDDGVRIIGFRGGKVSAAVVAACFAAVIVVRYLPSFLPHDFGTLTKEAVTSLGCIDFELSEILVAMDREVNEDDTRAVNLYREFLSARDRGLRTAGNVSRLQDCALALSSSSPATFEAGSFDEGVGTVADAVVDFYAAKAKLLAALHEGDDAAAFLAKRTMEQAWDTVEASAFDLSTQIGEVIAR